MKIASLFVVPALLCAITGAADAQQFQSEGDISGSATGFRYVGNDPELGSPNDGGRDAFDDYGELFSFRNLTVLRQTELFQSQNLFRFLDTFTNNTDAVIRTTVNFSGNLGSDSRTTVLRDDDGLLVSCQADDGVCNSDPVIAHVFSNKSVGLAAIGAEDGEDNYNALFRVVLNPGESASLLNFAFLASEEADTTAADVDLAIARGLELQANPFVTGLNAAQRARIINFDIAAAGGVPEPATWAMMIGGFGMVGGAMRRTRRRPTPAVA